mmetsp:Transcript_7378/g.20919  ORF Transcript_7378/g.20919 Transcript_7378/m.20919 type:complete len:212 (-) Transcript_7378:240-875(-)
MRPPPAGPPRPWTPPGKRPSAAPRPAWTGGGCASGCGAPVNARMCGSLNFPGGVPPGQPASRKTVAPIAPSARTKPNTGSKYKMAVPGLFAVLVGSEASTPAPAPAAASAVTRAAADADEVASAATEADDEAEVPRTAAAPECAAVCMRLMPWPRRHAASPGLPTWRFVWRRLTPEAHGSSLSSNVNAHSRAASLASVDAASTAWAAAAKP